MEVVVDDEVGGEIRAVRAPDGRNALAWYDWISPTPVGRGSTYGDPEMDWLSAYRGGWQETVPNAGLVCTVDGVEMGFHGDASRTRWEVVGVGNDWCDLRCSTRLPLVVERRMWLSSERAALMIEGRVTNTAAFNVDFVWGQHPAFPLAETTRFDVPDGCIVSHDPTRPSDLAQERAPWPMARNLDGEVVDLSVGPGVGTHRLLYLDGHREGWAAVRQTAPNIGVALAWDVTVHPFIWLWTLRETREFPWYGRASMVALEAQRASPYDGLAAASQRGQALTVDGGKSIDSWYTLVLLDDDTQAVRGVARDGVIKTAAILRRRRGLPGAHDCLGAQRDSRVAGA